MRWDGLRRPGACLPAAAGPQERPHTAHLGRQVDLREGASPEHVQAVGEGTCGRVGPAGAAVPEGTGKIHPYIHPDRKKTTRSVVMGPEGRVSSM